MKQHAWYIKLAAAATFITLLAFACLGVLAFETPYFWIIVTEAVVSFGVSFSAYYYKVHYLPIKKARDYLKRLKK